jgi:hypothetical protein
MAGSPGPHRWAHRRFGLWSICNDDESIWQWQMERRSVVLARDLKWMSTAAPDVRIC